MSNYNATVLVGSDDLQKQYDYLLLAALTADDKEGDILEGLLNLIEALRDQQPEPSRVEHLIGLYLTYRNGFLTLDRFAEWLEVPIQVARSIILKGRVLHQDQFGHH